ncbi:PqiC family protein [Vibrio sp.]|nr:PqiC family protein [Vibrio sp.]
MTNLIKQISALLCIVLLSACSSNEQVTTPQYLLPYPAKVEASQQSTDVKTIRLKSISIPNYLQKQNIVLVNDDGQVYQAANHLWAESLEHQLEQMTLTYLATRLPAIDWLAPSQYQVSSDYMTINVEKFYASQVGQVTVSGYWTIWSKDNTQLLQKRFYYTSEMSEDGYLAMSKTLSHTWFRSVLENIIGQITRLQPID